MNTSSHETGGHEVEFKLPVADESAFSTLAALLGSRLEDARTVLQENHFFDTAAGTLREAGFSLRLRFEGDRRLLTAKGAATRTEGALKVRPEEEVEVDAVEAERILADNLSPLEALSLALAPGRSALVDAIEKELGEAPLVHVGSFRNVRRYLGPLELAGAPVTFELDRTELPGGRVDHEIEVEVDEASAEAFETELRRLAGEVGARWETVPSKLRRFFEALESADEA